MSQLPVTAPTSFTDLVLTGRANNALRKASVSALVRQAVVAAEAQVAAAKLANAARVAQSAAAASTMLHHYGNALANGDPLLREELRQYEAVFRAGATNTLVDLFSNYSRESWG